ncbi:MAG: hypothetical protein D6712_14480, partial [Chloroflexi bacterium]
PAVLWVYLGLGIPAALLLLPRRDWRQRPLVIMAAFAFGPMLLTAWMFVLGTIGAANADSPLRLTHDAVLAGTGIIFVVLIVLLAIKTRYTTVDSNARPISPLHWDEKLIISLIAFAVVLRWLTISYWPFTGYDPMWVYGYEGRLYTLLGHIPQDIGYYPQFIPLQYTFGQLIYGDVNDHAARTVMPFIHIGSIFAVYILGTRLFNRRTGIWAAGIWALYPHVGHWAHIGDLEIPTTFLFTGAAAFFLMAWYESERRLRWHYGALAGLFLGGALWTKPTAGALVWGVMLAVGLEFLRVKGNWRAFLPRFEAAFFMGVFTVPLGGLWYVRNILLGHNAVDFPPDYWLSLAERSGREFSWPLVALALLVCYLLWGAKYRPNVKRVLLGAGLIFAGTLPTIIPLWTWQILQTPQYRINPPDSYINPIEWALIATGVIILLHTLWQYVHEYYKGQTPKQAAIIGWMAALALPYFFTWFYSYSYHYRLSFPIVPLMLMPSAVIVAHWLTPERLQAWSRKQHRVYRFALIALAIPGTFITFHDYGAGWDWFFTDKLPDDRARYGAESGSLMMVVDKINEYIETHDTPPKIIAPNAELLPFHFPLLGIDIESLPTQLSELEGATHFIYSKHALRAYEQAGIVPPDTQIVAALGRREILTQITAQYDGNFFYELYELNIDNRFKLFENGFNVGERYGEVVFGDVIRFVGNNVSFNRFIQNERITFEFVWQPLQPIDEDYMIYIHLRDPETGEVYATWDGPVAPNRHAYYSTKVWEVGEYILDRRQLSLRDFPDVPNGDGYKMVIGVYNWQTGERLPVTIDGEPVGDGITLLTRFGVRH